MDPQLAPAEVQAESAEGPWLSPQKHLTTTSGSFELFQHEVRTESEVAQLEPQASLIPFEPSVELVELVEFPTPLSVKVPFADGGMRVVLLDPSFGMMVVVLSLALLPSVTMGVVLEFVPSVVPVPVPVPVSVPVPVPVPGSVPVSVPVPVPLPLPLPLPSVTVPVSPVGIP